MMKNKRTYAEKEDLIDNILFFGFLGSLGLWGVIVFFQGLAKSDTLLMAVFGGIAIVCIFGIGWYLFLERYLGLKNISKVS